MSSIHTFPSQETVDLFVNSLHTLSGLHVGLHDNRRDRCQSSAGDGIQNLCTFCQNRCAAFLERCRACDSIHIEEVQMKKETQIYSCHFGLTEVLIPIIDEDTVTGVIFLGKVRIAEDPKAEFQALAEHLMQTYPQFFSNTDTDALLAAYNATASVTQKQLHALIDLADISIHGMYLDRWIRGQNFSTKERFQRYLEDMDLVHIPLSELSVQQVAEQLHMSYSQLNRLSAAVTGFSFKQYVLNVKIQNAANLLLSNRNKKIGDIASSVGFDDIYYFSRVFARKMGMSCMEYRKINQ